MNITPRLAMLKVSLLTKLFQSLWLRKNVNFTNTYNTLKSHKKDARVRLLILILKLTENSPGCLANLFVSRLTYDLFLFNY